MAGGIHVDAPSGGGKKPLDTAINLVPFIDLMAVTISFLIMTAVWNQVGRLPVSQGGVTDKKPPITPTVPVRIEITRATISIVAGAERFDFPRGPAELFSPVQAKLKEIRASLPTSQSVTVASDDDVRYADLVRVIDACRGMGLDDLSVEATSG